MIEAAQPDGMVSFEIDGGPVLSGTLLKLSRHVVCFQVDGSFLGLHVSDVLREFTIVCGDQEVYQGRAVVHNLVDTGLAAVCEAGLDEGWYEVGFASGESLRVQLRTRFAKFAEAWQRDYRVLPEFKTLIADMRVLLMDMRLWLDQVDLAVHSSAANIQARLAQEVAAELGSVTAPHIDALWSRFEPIAACIEDDSEVQHGRYLRRHLHSLLLCSPFAQRAFHKPLGYAGDYLLVDMIARNQPEGASLFAKMVNYWLLQQPPSVAHRNRIDYLHRKLKEEILRVASEGRMAHIYSLGCGPAIEVQRSLADSLLTNRAQFTLVDFNAETLQHVREVMGAAAARPEGTAPVQLVKKSVQEILKEASRPKSVAKSHFDFIYCAGLFDYLADAVCQRLLGVLYRWLRPGGLLLATNVDAPRPYYLSMEYMLDWHLICRSAVKFQELVRLALPSDQVLIRADFTGFNVIAEIRKPIDAEKDPKPGA